jgi:hypothetical protein
VSAGRWRRLARRVYLAADEEPTLLQRVWCAQLIGGAASTVSGALACLLLGIADVPHARAVVLVAASCQRRGDDAYVVRRTSRSPTSTDWQGLRVAEPPRAVVDACRGMSRLRDVRGLVCAAINGKHTSYDELVIERAAEPRAGLRLLGHALQDWSDGARSAPEAEVADALRVEVWAGRLPPFLLNPKVYDGAVLLGAPDVYVPSCALGAETDSVRHHGDADQLDATLTRHKLLTSAGIELELITPGRFRRNPAGWAARFAAIAGGRWGVGEPVGLRIEPIGPLQPVPGRRRR